MVPAETDAETDARSFSLFWPWAGMHSLSAHASLLEAGGVAAIAGRIRGERLRCGMERGRGPGNAYPPRSIRIQPTGIEVVRDVWCRGLAGNAYSSAWCFMDVDICGLDVWCHAPGLSGTGLRMRCCVRCGMMTRRWRRRSMSSMS
jgi:hypothetical protein